MRIVWHGRIRRAPPWDCGFPLLNARMQDTAEGFGQPVRQVFEPFFRIEQQVPTPSDERPSFREVHDDRLWHWLYLPIARGVDRVTSLVTVLQRGRISVYLTYASSRCWCCCCSCDECAMISIQGLIAQFAVLALAVLLAPMLTGWVNQCRAWRQNRSAPPLLQPYRVLTKLFNKEVVLAHNASPLLTDSVFCDRTHLIHELKGI